MTTLYAALAETFLVVTGRPGAWNLTRALTEQTFDYECVAADAAAPNRVFCGTRDDGLVRSEDGGETWNSVGTNVLPSTVTAVTVSPHDPDVVWVGTEPSAVFRSTDGGDTWAETPALTDLPSSDEWYFPPRPSTHHVRWVAVDHGDPEHQYVSIEQGALVQSDDAGETWNDRPSTACRDNHSLTTHPDAPGRAYAAAGDGYAATDDWGETWTHPQKGLGHGYLWSVAVDPGDPKTVLVSAAHGPRAAHTPGSADSYIYRRRGGPWERCGRGVPTGYGVLRQVLVAGDDAGEFYALTNHGIARTTDAGDQWRRFDLPWEKRYERQTPAGLAVVP